MFRFVMWYVEQNITLKLIDKMSTNYLPRIVRPDYM